MSSWAETVKRAQALTNTYVTHANLRIPRLTVDGVLGPRTNRAVRVVTDRVPESVQRYEAEEFPVKTLLASSPASIRSEIAAQAGLLGVDKDFATIVQSIENPRMDPLARSPTGAIGLYQVFPAAAVDVRNIHPAFPAPLDEVAGLADIRVNIAVGVGYLKWVAAQVGINPLAPSLHEKTLVYAGYNIGIGNLRRLRAGQFDHPGLVKAVSVQGLGLRAGGTRRYLQNLETYFS